MGSSPDAESAVATPAEEKEKPTEDNWTLRKVKVLISVVYGNFFLGSCYSLMAPIFPPEAEKKGASATAYGLVFGIYQLVMFTSSPIYGKFMPKLNPGFMMKAGMLVSGCCVIAFGLLDYAPYGYPFICLAFLVRIIDAFGAAAFLIASYTTLGCELPDMMGRAMAVTEAAFASGLAVGPAIGGFLYEVGGFPLPFFVIGSLLLTGVAANFILYRGDDKEIFPQTIKLRELLSDLDFLVDMLCISTCFAMIAFNEASLEPHIRRFQLTPTATGAVFLIAGIVDTIASPILGYVAEKISNAQYLTLVGTLLFTVCYLIVGPVPILKFQTNFWAVMVSQFLLGLGMACVIVCSFTHGMKHFIEKGYPDEVGTYSMTSGLIFSASCFGAFVGPSLGGLMIDKIGYIKTTTVVVIVTILVAMICASRLLYVFIRKATKKIVNLQSM